jgi:hypothetical protein
MGAQHSMTRKVLLNNVDHHDLKVLPRFGAGFGDSVNQLPVFPTEFETLQREFPILFRKSEDGFQSVILLGLDRDENLFLNGDSWTTRHVPAIQRRGPFSITCQRRDQGEGQPEPMIHVDLDDPRVGREAGFPLFRPHGGNAPYLEEVVAVLATIYEGMELASPMFAAFQALALIQPVSIELALDEERTYSLPSFHAVSAERFAALDGAALEQLHRGGFLAPALHALSSLGNIARLIEFKNKRAAGAAGAQAA